jgi:hypothetical protein
MRLHSVISSLCVLSVCHGSTFVGAGSEMTSHDVATDAHCRSRSNARPARQFNHRPKRARATPIFIGLFLAGCRWRPDAETRPNAAPPHRPGRAAGACKHPLSSRLRSVPDALQPPATVPVSHQVRAMGVAQRVESRSLGKTEPAE